jgi:type I restriction enzyme S subunit
MKQGWENRTLGDVLDVLRNGVNCKQDKKGVGDKISRIESISNAYFDIDKVGFAILSKSDKEKYRLAKGDILFSHINSPIHVGKTGLFNSDEEVYHGVNLLLMRPKPFLDGNYFEHFLKFLFQNGYWKGLCKQSVNQASVNQQDINKVKISYPKSLPEQKRIVAILDEAFAAIAKAKANAEQNLKNAKELFESYLQGVFENGNWEIKSFNEVCEIASKLIDPRKPEFQNFIHVGAGNIESKTGLLSGLKTAKEENLISGKFLFDESMILYSKIRPYLMKVVNCDFQGLCSADIYPLKPFENLITKDYLYHLLLTKEFTDYAILGSQRAGMPKVNREHLFAYKLKLPSMKEQKSIVKRLDALQYETKKLENVYQKKINDLEELKKSILQKAFAGELKTEKELA